MLVCVELIEEFQAMSVDEMNRQGDWTNASMKIGSLIFIVDLGL